MLSVDEHYYNYQHVLENISAVNYLNHLRIYIGSKFQFKVMILLNEVNYDHSNSLKNTFL